MTTENTSSPPRVSPLRLALAKRKRLAADRARERADWLDQEAEQLEIAGGRPPEDGAA